MSMEEVVQKSKFTVLIGKNGAGKSTLLRALNAGNNPNIKYVSPERGGTLKYDPNVDNNISTNANWLKNTRQTNRFEQFRQQSAAQFRNLETSVLREIEKHADKRADLTYTFDAVLEQINALLPAIRMVRNDNGGFSVQTKAGEPLDESDMSSGESELIALAIEVLVFSRQSMANKILLGLRERVWVKTHVNQIFGSMQVRTFRRRYSSSRSPYARRWMTRILLLSPSTKPSETLFFGLQ
jgi:hypothetical protein